MELIVYSPALVKLGLIDAIDTLVWTRRFRAAGEVALKVPFSDAANELLKDGNLLMQAGGTEAMQISYVNLAKDSNGRDTIEAQGNSLLQWLDRRVMLTQIISDNLTAQAILNRMVTQNVISPADNKRKIPNVVLSSRAAYSEAAIDYKSDEDMSVLACAEALMATSKMGCQVLTNPDAKTHTVDFYRGRDLTDGSASPCIFSVDFGNLGEQNYTYSTQNLKTMAYIRGAEVNTDIGNDKTGLDRREMIVSAGDISNTYTDEDGNEINLTDAQVLQKLQQRGREELEQNITEQTFTGAVNQVGALQYKTDFDIGDEVTCIYNRWGVTVDTTVTEIVETYQGNRETITVTFGDGTPSLLTRLRQAIG